MAPAFDVSQLSPATLAEALRSLPPRAGTLLRRRLARGEALEDCATFYGVSLEAFSTHLLREALALTARTGGQSREPVSAEEEAAWTRQLSAALGRPSASVSPALADTVALCQRLLAIGPAVESTLDALDREEALSPRRRREDILRRGVVVLLLALASYLYWTRPPDPAEPPVRSPPSAR
ncbi:hypothetical protein [Stigmatella aurantiaca]|uniref:Conserved uncharacterized protein n=1 Tax=Stigmatella aurantiaca (strain DW4/3-1) TaxID=378806 RepID=E3FSL9_STIAD|nr:hypothetical protein [Stigmatella aurantiaca]ADO73315.1 conserved uncharacterized protein [Stigmatella aurantiaca DW4/3-1]